MYSLCSIRMSVTASAMAGVDGPKPLIRPLFCFVPAMAPQNEFFHVSNAREMMVLLGSHGNNVIFSREHLKDLFSTRDSRGMIFSPGTPNIMLSVAQYTSSTLMLSPKKSITHTEPSQTPLEIRLWWRLPILGGDHSHFDPASCCATSWSLRALSPSITCPSAAASASGL